MGSRVPFRSRPRVGFADLDRPKPTTVSLPCGSLLAISCASLGHVETDLVSPHVGLVDYTAQAQLGPDPVRRINTGLQDSFGKDDSDASNSSSVCETLKDLEAVIRKLGEDTGTSGGTPHDTVIQAALDQSSKIQESKSGQNEEIEDLDLESDAEVDKRSSTQVHVSVLGDMISKEPKAKISSNSSSDTNQSMKNGNGVAPNTTTSAPQSASNGDAGIKSEVVDVKDESDASNGVLNGGECCDNTVSGVVTPSCCGVTRASSSAISTSASGMCGSASASAMGNCVGDKDVKPQLMGGVEANGPLGTQSLDPASIFPSEMGGSGNGGLATSQSQVGISSADNSGTDTCLPKDEPPEFKNDPSVPLSAMSSLAASCSMAGADPHQVQPSMPQGPPMSMAGGPNMMGGPMSMPMSMSGAMPMSQGQPVPANLGAHKQPSTLEAQYMQQQSQIFVFSTQMANQAAEAVIKCQFNSIIAFHCSQPGTKKVLDKYPLKVNQFSKQNPAQWLNNLVQMKGKGGMKNMPPSMPGPMGPSGPMGPGGPMYGPGGPDFMAPGPMSAPQWNQGCGDPMMPMSGMMPVGGMMGPMRGPGPGQMSPMMGPGPMRPPGHMGPGGLPNQRMAGGPGGPVPMPVHGPGPGPGGPQGPMMGVPSPNTSMMGPGPMQQPSLSSVKLPDEVLTPQQRQHREEQLATLRKVQQMLFPEQQQGGPPHQQQQGHGNQGVVSQVPLQPQQMPPQQSQSGSRPPSAQQPQPVSTSGPGMMPCSAAPSACAMPSSICSALSSEASMHMGAGMTMTSCSAGQASMSMSMQQGPMMCSGNPMMMGPGPQMQPNMMYCGGPNMMPQQRMPMMMPNGGQTPPMGMMGPGPPPHASMAAHMEWQKLQQEFYENRRGKGPGPPPPPHSQMGTPHGGSGSGKQGPPPPYSPGGGGVGPPGSRQGHPSPATSNPATPNPLTPNPAEGMFGRTLQTYAAQQKSGGAPGPGPGSGLGPGGPGSVQTPQGMHSSPAGTPKEPNLMPVPSPQQIQYLNAFEGQELTIQKQPNTSLRDPDIMSPSLPPSSLDSSSAEQTATTTGGPMPPRLSGGTGPSTPVTPSAPHQPGTPSGGPKTPAGVGFPIPSPHSGPQMSPAPGDPAGSMMGPAGNRFPTPPQGQPGTPASSQPMKMNPSPFSSPKLPPGPMDLPLNPADPGPPVVGSKGPCGGGKMHFDPISSMADMTHQLTSGATGTPTSTMCSQMPPQGPGCMTSMSAMNSAQMACSNANQAQMVSFQTNLQAQHMGPGMMIPGPNGGMMMPGGPQTVNNTYVNATMTIQQMNIQNMGPGPGPGPNAFSPSPMHPGNGSPKNAAMVMGAPRGHMGPGPGMQQRMMGPRPVYTQGANIQVKASAPNTIQYLPTRPQTMNNQGPRGPPSLDFLQRFTSPMGNMDQKVPTHNLQYLPNSSQPPPSNMGPPQGSHGPNQPNMGPPMGQMGPMGMNGPMMVPGGGVPPNMNMGPMNVNMGGPRHMMRGPVPGPPHMYPGGGNPNPGGSDGMFVPGNGPPMGQPMMCPSGPNGQMFMPKGSPMNMMGHGGGPGLGPGPGMPPSDSSQPLPPSGGGFKNAAFMGPTTADPNYAQQFHNFQQQLYATNTRSGPGANQMQGGPGPGHGGMQCPPQTSYYGPK
ncbi:unnamed protein product [Darwinula stevensoni]|uniref:B-cell lymphoma 9 beta-catenin binding domain-containing protein n=1 Tax=Darwinula stevensoni TaxID=69355 RepID=A0A7R8XLS9_9CRUS|nr:unnamed protein product [Darwinula stevensoni]CAG0894639.1 unnamed protein product [Darwinula stevensoni]